MKRLLGMWDGLGFGWEEEFHTGLIDDLTNENLDMNLI